MRHLDPKKLTDKENGVEHLLRALSAWEETSDMQTFEKALYKVAQKSDEATHSYMLRLQAAFHDLGESVNVKDMHAFLLLRQSSLSNEDKRKF